MKFTISTVGLIMVIVASAAGSASASVFGPADPLKKLECSGVLMAFIRTHDAGMIPGDTEIGKLIQSVGAINPEEESLLSRLRPRLVEAVNAHVEALIVFNHYIDYVRDRLRELPDNHDEAAAKLRLSRAFRERVAVYLSHMRFSLRVSKSDRVVMTLLAPIFDSSLMENEQFLNGITAILRKWDADETRYPHEEPELKSGEMIKAFGENLVHWGPAMDSVWPRDFLVKLGVVF